MRFTRCLLAVAGDILINTCHSDVLLRIWLATAGTCGFLKQSVKLKQSAKHVMLAFVILPFSNDTVCQAVWLELQA